MEYILRVKIKILRGVTEMIARPTPLIYLVDDDECHLMMMSFMLRRMGFTRLRQFVEPISAYEHIVRHKPDLIVSDWNMNPIDGLELLTLVRNKEGLQSTPFVMVSANTSDAYWSKAIAAGVTDFLFKPFDYQTFRETVLISLGIGDMLDTAASVVKSA